MLKITLTCHMIIYKLIAVKVGHIIAANNVPKLFRVIYNRSTVRPPLHLFS